MTRALEDIQISNIEQSLESTLLPPLADKLLTFLMARYPETSDRMNDPFIPLNPGWNVVVHRQWINRRKVYTITVSMVNSPDQLVSTTNSVSARGVRYESVLIAVILRAAQWVLTNDSKIEVA